jgi:hypothetical protein
MTRSRLMTFTIRPTECVLRSAPTKDMQGGVRSVGPSRMDERCVTGLLHQ